MPAPHRLSKSADFRRVYGAGRRARRNGVRVVALQDGSSRPARVGVAVRRSAGGAVTRNRIKRRLRAAVARCSLAPGADLVLSGDASVASIDFGLLVSELGAALEAAGAEGGS